MENSEFFPQTKDNKSTKSHMQTMIVLQTRFTLYTDTEKQSNWITGIEALIKNIFLTSLRVFFAPWP